MAIVKRGNVEYTVAEDQVTHYLDKGFSLIDEHGKVLKERQPQNIKDYQDKIKALEARIAELEAALEEASSPGGTEDNATKPPADEAAKTTSKKKG